ncbi:MAG: T9SS type A sorting domain-containing protein [Bacteroidetes bacterium]|nr:T9SS type A sorting domain-containing protein [Bacteroidota bacterium]
MTRLLLLVVFLCYAGIELSAQEIFRLDFEEVFVPDDWSISDKSEWGHTLGEDGSSYFRFHPFSYRDFLQSPEMVLDEGSYTLYFSWNEAQRGSPDFCNVRIRQGEEYWDIAYTFGSGNNREWERDSVVFGNLDSADYTIEFEYKSLPRYPAQYLNIDNVFLVRSEPVVTATNTILQNLRIQVMPNPVKDHLNYSLNDLENRNFDLLISNAAGQFIFEKKNVGGISNGTIDVSKWPSGIYNLKFQNIDGYKNESIVIY